MELYYTVLVFILGTIIGSFLNVVLYRFHTGKSINGHSHCLSCGEPLRWYELFPLLSYMCLRGRCRTCSAYIPYRYFLVEFATGALFVLAWCTIANPVLLGLSLILSALLMVILVYDLRHTIIPDKLTFLVTVVALLTVSYQAYTHDNWEFWLAPVLSGFGAAGFYGLLWLISKGRWIGFGDVKLAFPLGLLVSWPLVFSMVVYSFWIGAIISLSIIGVQWLMLRGQFGLSSACLPLTIKSEVPFAPFLIAAFVLTYFCEFDVLYFMMYAFI